MASAFDLFISYSSRDKTVADALLAGLEADRIRCWMAPRNVETGKTWAGSILRGIRDADVFLLILTGKSNQSAQVLNEVERAVSLKKPIICYRAEDVVLSDDLELFLSSRHWIEASGQPVGATLPQLITAVRSLLARQQTASPPTPDDVATTDDDRDQCLRNGKRAYLAREFSLATDYFNEAAEAGSGEALFYLGELHRKGEGVKRAPARAKQFYTDALAKGSLLGNWGLARMLDDADELPDRARQYYEQAREAIAEKAVEEDSYGCYLYSLMYAEGKGQQKDAQRAERWLAKAKENGYQPVVPTPAKPAEKPVQKAPVTTSAPEQTSSATTSPTTRPFATSTRPKPVESVAKPVTTNQTGQRTVGQNTTSGTSGETTSSWKAILIGLAIVGAIYTITKWSVARTNPYPEESATDSTVTMDSNSYMMADTTLAVDTAAMDTTSSTSYSDKSVAELISLAEGGDAEAQNLVGRKYDDGISVPKDDQKAVEWYRKAAEKGNAWGQYNLGVMYHHGEGIRQSYGEAIKWYRKSADQGNASAQNNLGVMYDEGKGVKQSYGEAIKWYRKSADQGNAYGQYDLGDMYEYGKGVTKDITEAKRLYKLAADQGNAEAKKALARLDGK